MTLVRPMVEEVRIQGLGVIDEAVLDLAPGLNVVTGETGAGKTMVVTGLGLLLGGRADSDLVRTGAERTSVEGFADLGADHPALVRAAEAGADVSEGLILARNVAAQGRSRAYLGGRSVPISTLSVVGERLVAVHGQSDQHRLLRQKAQRDALDRFGGEPVLALVTAYAALHGRLEDTERELAEVVASARERAREADLLRFGLGEIEAVDPRPGEDAELAADLPVEALIRIAEEEASCELWGLLKRPDEKFVTERAYENPKFVEDLVRDVAQRLDADERVVAYVLEAENFESIHNHSAYALIERDKRQAA